MSQASGKMISFGVQAQSNSGYLALSSGVGPWPGVVVIQEWWGLDDHIKSIADRFAGEGFAALAPDLYNGQVATEPDEARKLRMALVWDEALAVIQGAVNYLIGQSQISPKKVGVVGFCMGGGLTWHAAAKLTHVGAAVPFYGGGPEMTDEEVSRISAPVLAIFAELDQGVSPQVANRRAAQMNKAGVKHETVIYPGAQHAFFNDTRVAYNPKAAADAWLRTINFFRGALV
jgi:carboxymethylenebutenolidase